MSFLFLSLSLPSSITIGIFKILFYFTKKEKVQKYNLV